MPSLRDYVVDETIPGHDRDVLGDEKIIDAAQRAELAGAELPLEYVGAGATGIVFTDGAVAYKVSRYTEPWNRGSFRREYEWLQTASEIQLPVATPFEWHPEIVVIVREMVEGTPPRNTHELYDEYHEMMLEMDTHGWGVVEFKPDSFVETEHGAILVDASNPIRLGDRLIAQVRSVIAGAELEDDTIQELRYALRMDVQMGRIAPSVGAELLDALPPE